ncbi:Eukaryotic translation initiation factor 4 gamma [Lachnellula cervina]|uniref:Eukaryotic translation initiation factor 4 gamma n=1 Tax=Lachnellula cervina TaxID=1316786 RepID=A0A7D8UZX8_9HELO|nr:Eukaryotic translation initiation factor 4 gamma [Lachnellula cervina]
MTSVSQQSQNPSQASHSSSASQSTVSYANAAKAVSSPPIATGSSTPSPAVAVGGSAPVQHGKTSSISPVNGRSSIPPAVPAVSAAPAIAHSSAVANGSATDHSRKSSVTISATGPNGFVPNGGPVGGSKSGIQFGSITDSPAASHSTPQVAQPTSSAPISIPSNPRVTSPAQSPTPIPQPSASGGRPPSGLAGQGNGVTFGSLGGDGDRHMRQASGTQGPLAPGNQQSGHIRRESSQSTQGEMGGNQGPGAGPGRGGFPPQGRGRGNYNSPQFQQQQQMGYPPGNSQYRNSSQGRGAMAPPFQGQARMPPFPNSPHQAARSPALAPSLPGTPNMNTIVPMQNPQQQYGGYGAYSQMQGQAVKNPSSSNHQSEFSGNKFNNNRGNKGGRNWGARNSEKYSSGRQRNQRDSSQEIYGHQYMSREHAPPLQTERDSYGQSDMRNFTMPAEPAGRDHSMQSPHGNESPPSAHLERRASSADQSALPPLPPPLSGVPRFDVHSIDLSPASVDFERFLTMQQGGYPNYQTQAFDQRGMPMMSAPYGYPQVQYMQAGPPQSPQPGYQQPTYIPGQYAPQPQPMSRNSSQMSADQRPASSMGQPQTPSMTPSASHPHTPQPAAKATASQSNSFSRPARKSAAIVIRKPDGGELDVEAFKAPASPAPSNRTRTPPVIASTPTPPPKSSTPQHSRSDSSAVKSKEQIQKEVLEAVKQKAAAEKSDKAADTQAKADEVAKAAEDKSKDEAKTKADAEAKAAEDAKAAKVKEEADAKAAADKAKQDEEEEMERQIREIEEEEAAREKKEAEILAKRNAERAVAEQENAAKRKQQDEENDRKLKEQEREMERLEDEREQKRKEAEGKGSDKVDIQAELKKDIKSLSKDDDKNTPATPSTLASKLSNLTLETDSGASTPASDDSMGPPPKVNASEKRGKPAALNLAPLNTKPVEAPQPSAALQSLKSARFLTAINPALYPNNINSPNPALNTAVTNKGKNFKYDKEFLLQFQKVFTEKPSLEFESQIKLLIGEGDGGSARSASARTAGGMGPRQGSARNNAPGAFAMGQFGAVGGKTLPPGTTSDQRFAMASGQMARPPITTMNSMNSLPRMGGGSFPGGNPMSRQGSQYNIPNSPRTQNKSQRNNSRPHGHPPNAKAEAQAAKTMPLTAGMDLKPIQVSASGWKPRSIGNQAATGAAGPAPGASGASGHMEPDMVQRKVKAALNKMTPEKFDKIADQILAIAAQSKDEADGRTLRQVIQLTFEKATDEAHWASMYAKFCKRMLETMSPDIKDESILDKNGNIVSGGNLFRKYLLNRCQEEFERGWKMDLPDKPEGERGDEKSGEAAMLSEEYYIAAGAKRRGLGLVQFIGELYKLSMLTERIMHECVKKLVDYTGIPDEAEIESLTKLLKTIGANLDSTEKGKPMMDVYFSRIEALVSTPDLPSRLRFMLMDIVDLRKKRWQSKEQNKGPKTLEEVRAEAEAAAAQKAAENARGPQRGGGGGGGGRMQMGRGDSRNFSNQYGNQPPVDYQKNTVGMDDLRRLTNKNSTNRHSSQQMSFGPTSMFSSRSNSRQNKMGPGGSLSRAGEDSGASSRTGTPPQQKEKESATSANAFSLLAGLGSGEAENPASPPSTSVSPALSKATPASADKSEDKKGSES